MSRDSRQIAWTMGALLVVGGCVWYQTATQPHPPDTRPRARCVHKGRQSSHGARLRLPGGWVQCDNGRWTPVAAQRE